MRRTTSHYEAADGTEIELYLNYEVEMLKRLTVMALGVYVVVSSWQSSVARAEPGTMAAAPICQAVLTKPIPGMANRFKPTAYPQITLAKGVTIDPLRVRHIFHGDFNSELVNPGKPPMTVLDGGMHTREALIDLFTFRPDIARVVRTTPGLIEFDANDVMTVMLPENAFSQRALRNDQASQRNGGRGIKKTFFPAKWTNDTILSAIREVAQRGAIASHDDRSQIKVGRYNGVELRVFLERDRQGWTVSTAYPVKGK